MADSLQHPTGDGQPVLYSFRRCPYAMRARMALLASGQQCELREVVLRDKPAALLAASPKGTVPVLVLADSSVIDQSLAIMCWALQRNDPMRWLEPRLDTMLALIDVCDGEFKYHLDRYKYPQRYADTQTPPDAGHHRTQAERFIEQLERQLAASGNPDAHLFTPHATLADYAIAPFVRQFAQVEPGWFASQPWPRVQSWLTGLMASPIWRRAMETRYPPWKAGSSASNFPPNVMRA